MGKKTWYWLRVEMSYSKSRGSQVPGYLWRLFCHFLPLLLVFLLKQPSFCFSYCFGTVDLAISRVVEKLLLAFPNNLYRRCWSTSTGVLLPLKTPRYLFCLNSLFIRLDSKNLAISCLLSYYIPYYQQLIWSCITRYLQPQILFLALVKYCSNLLALFLWYPALAITYKIHHIFSIW